MKSPFKKIATLLMLLLLHPVFSQEGNMENDTIAITEVIVTKNSKKLKLKSQVFDGPCYYSENMHEAEEIVTLAKPGEGSLESVTFYFNDILTKKSQSEKFRDNEFELVLYTVGPDDTPGTRIEHDPLKVKVARDFAGKLTVDLAILAVDSPKQLFIGLKRLTPPQGKDEFFIDCICNGLDKYVTMVRKDAAASWERRWQCAALKAEVSVAVKR